MANAIIKIGLFVCGLAFLAALVLYPAARWLFAVPLAGIVTVVAFVLIDRYFGKDPTPDELANMIEAMLEGRTWGFDIDDFEYMRLRNAELAKIRRECYRSAGMPEEWPNASPEGQQALKKIIEKLRCRTGREGD